MELDIVKLLAKQSNLKRFSSLIREERLSKDIRFILQQLQPYFSDTAKPEVDWDEFNTWVTINHPNLSDERMKAIQGYLWLIRDGCQDVDCSVLRTLSTRHWAEKISDAAYEVSVGDAKMSRITELLREYNMEVKGVEWDLDSLNLSDTEMMEQLQELKDAPKYSWSVPELELMLGSICKGDFIILGARPDGGKTTLLSTQAVHWAKQLEEGECILRCNNEESASRVRLRQTQAALAWTREEVMKDLQKSVDTFNEKVGVGRIKMLDNTSMTVHDIEASIEACNPKIIIIDQIWKVGGFEKTSHNGIDRYAKLAQYVRELAKRYGPIIGASQLDGSADGEKYPKMNALYNSKTAVQGEADAIVCIGQNPSEGVDIRFLSAPKNKLSYANNDFRNAGAAVRIDKERAQIVSLLGAT